MTLRWRLMHIGIAAAFSITFQVVAQVPASADRAGAVAVLPTTVTLSSAIWDGKHAYVFGGMNGVYSPYGIRYLDSIFRFDPVTRTSTLMQGRLASPRADTAAVWTGQYAYVFGGQYCYYYYPDRNDDNYAELACRPTTEITRYDPVTDTSTTMVTRLPETVTRGLSAVWSGTYVYLFGGCCSPGNLFSGGTSSTIWRYDPVTDQLRTLRETLPSGRFGTSAIWDGDHAYIFGGQSSASQYELTCCPVGEDQVSLCCSGILRFDPAASTVADTGVRLPSRYGSLNRMRTSAIWDGTHAYVFGGGDGLQCCGTTIFDDASYYRDIVRFDPASTSIETMAALLPSGNRAGSAVWDGTHAYIFGGCSNRGCTNDVVKYVLAPGPPQGFRVDPVDKQMVLRWDPPAANTYSPNSPIIKYRIYKGSQPGILGLWAEVSATTSSKADTSCVFITRCYYAISATNALGEGERSAEVIGLGSRSF